MRRLIPVLFMLHFIVSCRSLHAMAVNRDNLPINGTNLLANPGFEIVDERNLPSNWQMENRKDAIISFDKGVKGFGLQSLKVFLQETKDVEAIALSQAIPSQYAGKTVVFGGWVKTENTMVTIMIWTPEGGHSITERNINNRKFSKIEKTCTIPKSATIIRVGILIHGKRQGTVWLDDIFVSSTAASIEESQKKASSSETASIQIDGQRIVKNISPLLFGNGLEWTDNAKGIWDERAEDLREEVIVQLARLKTPVWRFPGGILADYYHWKDGIGPQDSRPLALDPYDKSYKKMSFGTDEFIEFSKRLEATALITVNFGTGSVNEATAWLDYFRSRDFPVQYWEIGNEIYLANPKDAKAALGAQIYHSAEDYAKRFIEYARALRKSDVNIKVGAIGGVDTGNYRILTQPYWVDTVLRIAGKEMDFIALHGAYAPAIQIPHDYYDEDSRNAAYYTMMASTKYVEDSIQIVKEKIRRWIGRPLKIAMTEHAPFFGEHPKTKAESVDQSRTLAAALFTASLLSSSIRDNDIFMANYTGPIHKYYGTLLTDTTSGLVRTPTYYVYMMYGDYAGTQLVKSKVTCANFDSKPMGIVPAQQAIPYLDVTASLNSGKDILRIMVINRNLKESVNSEFEITNFPVAEVAEAWTLTAESPNSVNGPSLTESCKSHPKDTIHPEKKSITVTNSFSYIFPPCSVTSIVLKGKDQ